jgi:type IV secretory pathway VirB2 component (pilin)
MNKPKSIMLWGAAAVAVIGALSFPSPSSGQAAGDEQALAQLITEIAGQQAKILTNQQVIDQKVALIEENMRVARIYVSRGGGKTK